MLNDFKCESCKFASISSCLPFFFVQPLRFPRFVAFVSQLRYRTKLCCGGGDCDSEHDTSSFRPTPAQQTDGNSCSYSTVNDITPSYCGSRSRQQTLLQASPSHFPHHWVRQCTSSPNHLSKYVRPKEKSICRALFVPCSNSVRFDSQAHRYPGLTDLNNV